MYVYSQSDQQLVEKRASEFLDQTTRYLAKELPEETYQQLRLRNGLYMQKHAPMLRVAIPYGMISSKQLRKLAYIARKYDKGYAHFTTRQNIQFNWPPLEDVPAILRELASVQMHAIQTSGSCIRNVTSDQYAGVARDEIEDPRPWAELIRQWSTLHPEFNWLPRKFKIAITGATKDRAATRVHDIGIRIVTGDNDTGFEISVGGGLGRTPMLGSVIREFLPKEELLYYLEAILRIYNRFGRRDNKYKARIKILVRAMTPEVFASKVEEEWIQIRQEQHNALPEMMEGIFNRFTATDYDQGEHLESDPVLASEEKVIADSSGFTAFVRRNTLPHKKDGFRIVNISLKSIQSAPGDVSADQLEALADLAEQYSFSEARVTHEQNITLADVSESSLRCLWEHLCKAGLAEANYGLLTDIICCPGGDFCSLANARSIPVAKAIQEQFNDSAKLAALGEIRLNISGCMNACAHHHVGNIGILGVDKKGSEFYQVSIGGSPDVDGSLGQILGPSFSADEIPGVVEQITQIYEKHRHQNEKFIETFQRIGLQPFRDNLYGS